MKQLASLLLLFVLGCGPVITSGRVSETKFIPKHTETNFSIDPQTSQLTTSEDDVPDRWYITFHNEVDGQDIFRTLTVEQEDFNRFKAGDKINIGENGYLDRN